MSRLERDYDREIAEREGLKEKLDLDVEIARREEILRSHQKPSVGKTVVKYLSKGVKYVQGNRSNLSRHFGVDLTALREAGKLRRLPK